MRQRNLQNLTDFRSCLIVMTVTVLTLVVMSVFDILAAGFEVHDPAVAVRLRR
jgi:hypothetical protein